MRCSPARRENSPSQSSKPLKADTSTPPDAIRIQFMVEDIFETTEELERRGIAFTQTPNRSRKARACILPPSEPPTASASMYGEKCGIATAEVVEIDEAEEVEAPSEVEAVDEHSKAANLDKIKRSG